MTKRGSYRPIAGSVTVRWAEDLLVTMKRAVNPPRTVKMTSKHAVLITASYGSSASATHVAVLEEQKQETITKIVAKIPAISPPFRTDHAQKWINVCL
jgi:hypothetical protein